MSGKPLQDVLPTLKRSLAEGDRIFDQRYGGTMYWKETTLPLAKGPSCMDKGYLAVCRNKRTDRRRAAKEHEAATVVVMMPSRETDSG
jgi:hypothetical protein